MKGRGPGWHQSKGGSVMNDPPHDSIFTKLDPLTNRCSLCGAEDVTNTTEHREAHLQRCPGWAAHCEGRAYKPKAKRRSRPRG